MVSRGADFLTLVPEHAPSRGRPAWLADQIRDAVITGRLAAGDVLPPSRSLAVDLGWSRAVVVEAYTQLSEQGIVKPDGRRGTRVQGISSAPVPTAAPAEIQRAGSVIDLSPGVPDLSFFPGAAWLRAEREVLSELGSAALRYADPAGVPELRHQVANWLRMHRGIHAEAGDVLIVSGVAQALALIAHVLSRRGHRAIGVEDPGSRGARDTVAYWGLTPVAVPVDVEGIDIEALARIPATATMLTPAHEFPVGVVLSAARRAAVLDWADAVDGYVVEDDYDAEQRYDRTAVRAMQTLAPHRVIHTGSVSKSLAPALRLGWIIAPGELREDLREAKYASDIANPTVQQLVLARLMSSGAYDAHLRRIRRHQRQRRNLLIELLHAHAPEAQISGVAAGLHVMVTFPDRNYDDEAVARDLAGAGVVVDPLSRHRMRPGLPGFVLGYAAHPPTRLEDAIRLLVEHVGERPGRRQSGPADGSSWPTAPR